MRLGFLLADAPRGMGSHLGDCGHMPASRLLLENILFLAAIQSLLHKFISARGKQ